MGSWRRSNCCEGSRYAASYQRGADDISQQRGQIMRNSLEEGGGQEPDAGRLEEEIKSDFSGG